MKKIISNIFIIILFSSFKTVIYSDPVEIDDINLMTDKVQKLSDSTWVANLKDAAIVPILNGTIFNDKHQFIYQHHLPLDANITKLVVQEYDKLATVYSRWGSNYFHFVMQVLPRLIFIKNVLHNDQSIKILFESSVSKFMHEYLSLLGIDSKRIIKAQNRKIYKANLLYFPSPIKHINKNAIEIIQSTFSKIINESNENKDLIIIIKRNPNSGPGRAILNHDEMVKKLKSRFRKYDKQIVIFDGKISVLDQIKLFARAKIVIAPHGAGLTNLIYCPSDVTVIEFLPDKYQNKCFEQLCKVLNLNYYQNIVCCENIKTSNFKIDVKILFNILDKILN